MQKIEFLIVHIVVYTLLCTPLLITLFRKKPKKLNVEDLKGVQGFREIKSSQRFQSPLLGLMPFVSFIFLISMVSVPIFLNVDTSFHLHRTILAVIFSILTILILIYSLLIRRNRE